jgi:hypothetical protein
MMRLRRRNYAWLTVIGVLVALVLLSGAATVEVSAALVGLFALALAASVIEFQPSQFMSKGPRSTLAMMRMSPQAREAVERARRRGSGALESGPTLMDIGLISSQAGSEGMVMRRSRTINKDDDGVRPFITLHVPPEEADRTALVRFEMLDPNGSEQYIHEMKAYLRDGEMNILTDHHLPLAASERSLNPGDWDLRVYVDGVLLGAQAFTMMPSIKDRQRQFSTAEDGEINHRLQIEEEEMPLSLEQLLREQSRGNRQG